MKPFGPQWEWRDATVQAATRTAAMHLSVLGSWGRAGGRKCHLSETRESEQSLRPQNSDNAKKQLEICSSWAEEEEMPANLRSAVCRWLAVQAGGGELRQQLTHTPSTVFRHLPPNSARFSYTTEGALFISAQLSSDAVSALRKVRVLIWL